MSVLATGYALSLVCWLRLIPNCLCPVEPIISSRDGETICVVDTVNHNQSCWLATSQLSWIIYEIYPSYSCLHPNCCNRWLYTQCISILFCRRGPQRRPNHLPGPWGPRARRSRPTAEAQLNCLTHWTKKKKHQTYGEYRSIHVGSQPTSKNYPSNSKLVRTIVVLKSSKIQNYQPGRCAYYLLTMARAWNLTEPPFKCFTLNLMDKSPRQNTVL